MQKTLILSCSHRKNSASLTVATQCKHRVKHFYPQSTTHLLDFGTQPLPLWDEGVWNQEPHWQEALNELVSVATACDSIIVVVPEYAGMATPMAKNVMLFLTAEMVGHKPAFLVSVSAGIGGSYPIAEMRQSSYKNNLLLWLPNHVIIRSAGDFTPPFSDSRQQESLQRLDHGIQMLGEYAKVLPAVRESEAFQNAPFPFGM